MNPSITSSTLGYECGAMIENFNDIKVDDVIEGFIMEEIKPK
jgi:translation initiation factor IF-2